MMGNRVVWRAAAFALALTSALMWTWVVSARRATAQTASLLDGNPKNGLSHTAFLENALTNNPAALAVLRSSPLAQALVDDPRIASQLVDPHARAVLHEIVKCALGPTQSLTYTQGRSHWTWRGELGLCQATAQGDRPAGDWSALPPTLLCQELVTGCVMARVNALGKAVPLSLGGLPAALFPPRLEVTTERVLRERENLSDDPVEGTFIKSFSAPLCELGEECLWAPARSGTCATDSVVRLVIEDPSCATTPLRVCAGLHGCYGSGSPTGYPSSLPYSKILSEKVGACTASSALTFPCPSQEGVANTFSVMTRPKSPLSTPVSPRVSVVSGDAVYPAGELALFRYLEGAFYGNLFLAEGLDPICSVPPGETKLRCTRTCSSAACPPLPRLPSPNVYACYDLSSTAAADDDELGVAYLNKRVCAQPSSDSLCFPRAPVRCRSRCRWDAASASWQDCRGAAGPDGLARSFRPVTTRLNARCDVIGPGLICELLRDASAP